MASGKLRGFADYKCEVQSVDAGCQFPDAGGFAEWQIGNGKWQILELRW